MNKQEIQAKIDSLNKKLENQNLSDYHKDFRDAIKTLETKLENLGEATVDVVKPVKETKPKTERKPRTPKTKTTSTNEKPSDIEKAKAEIKRATGKTEEECEVIIEQYKALRAKSQERKQKEEQASKNNKERIKELKKDDNIIPTTTEKNAPAVIETATEEVSEKIIKQMDVIEAEAKKEAKTEVEKEKPNLKPAEKKEAIKEKTEEKVKVKTEKIIERVTIDTTALLKAIANSLGKFDKDSQKEFLIKLRSDIDKLLSSYSFGGLTTGATQGFNITQSNLSSSSVNPTMFGGGGGVGNKTLTRQYLEKKGTNTFTFGYGMPKDAIDKYGTKGGSEYFILPNGDIYKKSKDDSDKFVLIGNKSKMSTGGGVDEEIIYYHGVKFTRDLSAEKRIKKEHKRLNSEMHPSERYNFKEYVEAVYPHLLFKNNKIYTSYSTYSGGGGVDKYYYAYGKVYYTDFDGVEQIERVDRLVQARNKSEAKEIVEEFVENQIGFNKDEWGDDFISIDDDLPLPYSKDGVPNIPSIEARGYLKSRKKYSVGGRAKYKGNKFGNGGGVDDLDKYGTLHRGNEFIKYQIKDNGNYKVDFYRLEKIKGGLHPVACEKFKDCRFQDFRNVHHDDLKEYISENNFFAGGGRVEKGAKKRLAEFFRVPIHKLDKFKFDGNDNITELSKALNSSNDFGTETYYQMAIDLSKEDDGEYGNYSGGGKIEYNGYGVPKGYLYLTEFTNFDRKANGRLTDVSKTVLEDNLLEEQSESGQQIHAYLHDLPHFIEYDNRIPRNNPISPENDEPMTDNYLLFLPIEDEGEENNGVPFHTFFVDTQGYDYPRYITRLVNYFPSDYQTEDLGYMARGGMAKFTGGGGVGNSSFNPYGLLSSDPNAYSKLRNKIKSHPRVTNFSVGNIDGVFYIDGKSNNVPAEDFMVMATPYWDNQNSMPIEITLEDDFEPEMLSIVNLPNKNWQLDEFIDWYYSKLDMIFGLADSYMESRQMARGGMTEHGLKINDRIAFDLNTINKKENRIVVSDEKGKSHYVDLDKGKRYSHGGNIHTNHKI